MLKGAHLTLLLGPVVALPAPEPVLDALSRVEITHAVGQRSGFQLAFTFNNRSPLQTPLLLGAVQTPNLRVIIIVTLNGVPEVLMDGVVGRTSLAPSNHAGQSTLTVYGEDLTALMALNDGSGRTFSAMPPEMRVAEILSGYAVYGIVPNIIPSPFSEFPSPVDEIPAQNGSDLQYIQQLAKDVGNVFYLVPGPVPGTSSAYWGPEVKIGVPQPALNVDMDAFTNVESLNFDVNTQDRTLPIVYFQVPNTKQFLQVPVPDISVLNPPLGAIPLPPQRYELLEDTAALSPMQAAGRAMALASRSADSVTGSGALDVVRYGRVLKARQLVGVRGAGLAFDGLHFVTSVTSSLKRGEFKQSFKLARNGIVSLTPVVPV